MNPMQNKTPEERRAIALKGHATARRRREEETQRREEARARAIYLADEIAELERQRDSLSAGLEICAAANKLTGHALLSERQIVEAAQLWEGGCGVYFLIKGGRVVYVGQSVNVHGRVCEHAKSKDFDGFAWVPCAQSALDKLESLYIHALRPYMNGNNGPGGAKSAPLGLAKLLGL